MSFFEIFQPGARHLREERDRQNMLVSKPTHGGGAPLGIDLDAGVAVIKIPRRTPADSAEGPGPATPAAGEQTGQQTGEHEGRPDPV